MFRVTRYPMISKTESGRVRYRKKYRVASRVRVPAGHCRDREREVKMKKKFSRILEKRESRWSLPHRVISEVKTGHQKKNVIVFTEMNDYIYNTPKDKRKLL